jgi:hypothetical protein
MESVPDMPTNCVVPAAEMLTVTLCFATALDWQGSFADSGELADVSSVFTCTVGEVPPDQVAVTM